MMIDDMQNYDELARVNNYKAKPDAPKKLTDKPCNICGWNEELAIHQNPKLICKDSPYHIFET